MGGGVAPKSVPALPSAGVGANGRRAPDCDALQVLCAPQLRGALLQDAPGQVHHLHRPLPGARQQRAAGGGALPGVQRQVVQARQLGSGSWAAAGRMGARSAQFRPRQDRRVSAGSAAPSAAQPAGSSSSFLNSTCSDVSRARQAGSASGSLRAVRAVRAVSTWPMLQEV